MKTLKRARRRNDLERMKRKAKTIRPDQPNVIKYANHLQACSCMGCGNPRHHFKGKEKITMQERRMEEAT